MRGYRVDHPDPPALKRRLYDEHRIEVPIVETPHGWALRVSVQAYNDEGRPRRAQRTRYGEQAADHGRPEREPRDVVADMAAVRGAQRLQHRAERLPSPLRRTVADTPTRTPTRTSRRASRAPTTKLEVVVCQRLGRRRRELLVVEDDVRRSPAGR